MLRLNNRRSWVSDGTGEREVLAVAFVVVHADNGPEADRNFAGVGVIYAEVDAVSVAVTEPTQPRSMAALKHCAIASIQEWNAPEFTSMPMTYMLHAHSAEGATTIFGTEIAAASSRNSSNTENIQKTLWQS